MGVKVTNNAYGTISAGISSTDTTITLDSGQGARFPTLGAGDYFYGTLVDTSNTTEIVKVTARSTDSMTVVRGQDNTTASAFAIGDRFELRPTAALFESIPYDNDTTSTGYLDLPSGTTAQEPAAGSGRIRFDTDLGVVTYSDGTDWYKIAATIAQLSSVSGSILAGAATTLTLTGSGFLSSNLVVNFTQSSDSIDEDITVTPTSDTSATVTITSAIYSNVTAGNVVNIKVTNSDGMSSAVVTTTAVALPSGGTVTTSGNYRIHTFTSSGTFTNTVANLSTDILLVGGGGGGGEDNGGGGGGAAVVTSSSAVTFSSAGNSTVTVGAGGAGGSGGNQGGRLGSASSISGGITTVQAFGGGGGMTSFGSGTYTSTWGSYNQDQANGGGGAGVADGASGVGYGRPGLTHTATGYTVNDGNTGGDGSGNVNQPYCSGGGAGAGGNGASYSGSAHPSGSGGAGGNGVASSLSGSSVYYGGGGGGGVYDAQTPGAGTHGGGSGNNGTSNGYNASANRGGGGGGGARSASLGGNGGSGIVIIRYDVTAL